MPGPARPFRSGNPRENMSLVGARLRFLHAVDAVAPHVVDELVRDAGPAHNTLTSAGWTGPFSHKLLRSMPPAEALVTALVAWGDAHHLRAPDDWVLDAALRHLWHAARWNDGRLSFGAIGGTSYWDPTPTAAPPAYQPDAETGKAYLSRVREYMNAVETQYQAAGWAPASANPVNPRDLRWLAQHQVLRWSYGRIVTAAAPDHYVDVATVRKAITSLKNLLPIALRPERNRPK